MFKKVSESEQANAVYNFKIEELTRQLQEKENEKKFDPELEKKNEELAKRIKELEDDVKTHTQTHVRKSHLNKVEEEGKQRIREISMHHSSNIEELQVDFERKLKELKADNQTMQSVINKLKSEKSSLELDLLNNIRKTESLESQSKAIKNQVPMDQKNNIFGVLLKKTGISNQFLKDAQTESKKTEDVLQEVWKDKIDDLKKLRENIIHMTPQTVSSRSAFDDDYQNIDFDDEEAFKKMQEKLAKRDEEHRKEHEKKEREQVIAEAEVEEVQNRRESRRESTAREKLNLRK